jgi:hypothetical protein
MICGPDGMLLAEFLDEGEEGIVTADLNLGKIGQAKGLYDSIGHYTRNDISTAGWMRPAAVATSAVAALGSLAIEPSASVAAPVDYRSSARSSRTPRPNR